MSGLTVTYRLQTWKERRGRNVITEGAPQPPVASPVTVVDPTPRPTLESKAARTLALAHHIERLIEAGVLKNYADAARRLRVSRARVSQIVGRLTTPIQLQLAILTGSKFTRHADDKR